jgi:hypothetical protein
MDQSSDDRRSQTTHDVLTLQGGTLSAIFAGLEAEVPVSDERVPFVDLLETAAESAGENQTTWRTDGISCPDFSPSRTLLTLGVAETV